MRKLLMILVFLTAFAAPLFWSGATYALFDPFGHVDCSQGKAYSSAVCNDRATHDPSANPLTGPDGTLAKATNIIATVSGITAVIVIIIAGFRYVLADGNATDISNAKKLIIYAAVGLVIIALADVILKFFISSAF